MCIDSVCIGILCRNGEFSSRDMDTVSASYGLSIRLWKGF